MEVLVVADMDVGVVNLIDPSSQQLAGAILQDEYDIASPWHHHDMHQLQYAFEGSMELEDERGRHLLPRSLAGWIPAGTRHRNSIHRIRSVSILLAPGSVPSAGQGVQIVRVSSLMREMIAEAARWPLGSELDSTGAAFFSAFAHLCSEWILDRAPLTLPISTDSVLDLALAQARLDPAGSRMSDAARLAGLSERSLRRRCQTEIGMGWDEYRRRARLLGAITELGETDRSIAQIASEVGFESQSAFARAFRELVGLSPQVYRSQLRR